MLEPGHPHPYWRRREAVGGTQGASTVLVPDSKAKYPLCSLSSSLSGKSLLRIEMNKRLVLQGRDSAEGKGDPLNLL